MALVGMFQTYATLYVNLFAEFGGAGSPPEYAPNMMMMMMMMMGPRAVF